MSVIGAYPGTFDPPTTAHLAIAEAAVAEAGLDRLDLVVSEVSLGKGEVSPAALADRVDHLRRLVAGRDRLGVVVTTDQLLADVAAGYDVLVMGADKWAQIQDPAWYGSEAARDAALARLPTVLIVPRAGVPVPPGPSTPATGAGWRILTVDPRYAEVSSTAVRAGRHDWLAPGAATTDGPG